MARRRDVREDLLSAAATLFAQRGVEAVSLREITAKAKASNASAVHYHFGGRDGLVRALLDKHGAITHAYRNQLLDDYEAAGKPDLHRLAAAYVRPVATHLDIDGGIGYLQILADLVNQPDVATSPEIQNPTNSTSRWRELVKPLLPPEAVRLHRRFVVMQFVLTDLARRGRNRPGAENEAYVSHLVDLVTALLAAPLSEETIRHVRGTDPSHLRY